MYNGNIIKAKLENLLGYIVEFRVYKGHKIDADTLRGLEGEFIISTCLLPKVEGKKIISVDRCLNERNLLEIFHAISNSELYN
ncbi:hypothetical protein SAMN00017477_1083 [Peptoniphilus asaccharolyticus DSM 20463]|uniref:Uncharacterized protein n=1 Tax=Peptoniphilus asaccharolyticus DSM 20463 TaxID=573058 RepID=A0A1W1V2T0_PEPAS|nr:hypothetical protein [Peptoniphilus asaccharolyticus]MBL7576037.1 hypothetical protein [Peptoniphilus asaccharolyticus]SMB87334.1 hypothetical protein SAMN00017477_1083 [Peptoniphilus asaccharolyticus DSM 20463]